MTGSPMRLTKNTRERDISRHAMKLRKEFTLSVGVTRISRSTNFLKASQFHFRINHLRNIFVEVIGFPDHEAQTGGIFRFVLPRLPSGLRTARRKLGGRLGAGWDLRKIDWPFAFAVVALVTVLIAIVFEDYPRYADCSQQQANSDSLCHLPWWDYSGAWVAIFTIVLTVSTALLWWTTRETLRHAQTDSERQSKETREQIELSRKQFIATHRPNIAVRKIEYENGLMLIVIANVGTSDAILRMVYTGFGYKEWRSIVWKNKFYKTVIRNDRIPTGSMLVLDPNEGDVDFPMDRIANMSDRLFVFGNVSYQDDNGTYRKMGFIRWYDVQFNRFERLPAEWADSEMEYAD